MWILGWALIQYDWCPYKKRRLRPRNAWGVAYEDMGRSWQLQAKERNLSKNNSVNTCTTDIQLQNDEKINFYCLSHPLVFYYGSSRKLTHWPFTEKVCRPPLEAKLSMEQNKETKKQNSRVVAPGRNPHPDPGAYEYIILHSKGELHLLSAQLKIDYPGLLCVPHVITWVLKVEEAENEPEWCKVRTLLLVLKMEARGPEPRDTHGL